MVDAQRIQQVSDEIAWRFHPERIILFGSYAYGMPTETSDVDLLVVMSAEGRDIKESHRNSAGRSSGFCDGSLAPSSARAGGHLPFEPGELQPGELQPGELQPRHPPPL